MTLHILDVIFYSIILLMVLVALYYKQYMTPFNWAHKSRPDGDPVNSTETSLFKTGLLRFDKLQHLVGNIFMAVFGFKGILIGILYDYLQARFSYKNINLKSFVVRLFVGDGFSYKDVGFGLIGFMIGVVLLELIYAAFGFEWIREMYP